MATQPITELSERAREVFRVVVESYLGSGTPVGSRTISKLGGFNLSPASIRNVMQDLEEAGLLSAPHISAGRMPTEQGLRLFVDAIMQAAEPSAEERQIIERQLGRDGGPIENALSAASAALSDLSACAGVVMVPKREPRLRQIGFVPLSRDQAMAVLVGQDGSVENRVIALPPGTSPAALVEAANFVSDQLAGLTLGEARQRLQAEIGKGRRPRRCRVARAGRARPCFVVRGWRAPPGADRARPVAPDRRGRRGRSRTRPAAARRDRGSAGDRAAARQRVGGDGDQDLHRIREQAVRAVGLVGHRLALSRAGRPRGRGGGGDRPDPVELCAGGPHGGFHGTNTFKIDGMMDETENNTVREETAADAPEVAEHDRLTALEAELAEAKAAMLYAQAETQNVRRRLEKDAQDARAYAATSFARDILSVSDNLDRALQAIPADLREDERFKGLVTGLEATGRELASVFERNGITKISALGEKLDPNRHQAMIELPTADAEPGTVVQEMQAGYMIRDRLLRPALVAVARAAEEVGA
jgi:molecular chaperone GrpE